MSDRITITVPFTFLLPSRVEAIKKCAVEVKGNSVTFDSDSPCYHEIVGPVAATAQQKAIESSQPATPVAVPQRPRAKRTCGTCSRARRKITENA